MRAIPEQELGSLGADEVESCQNLTEGELGGYAFDLTVTNRSENLAKSYAVRSVIRNAAGERILTRIATVKGPEDGFTPLEPGEQWTSNRPGLRSVRTTPSSTCEVVAIDVYVDEEFFAFDGGVTAGSLSSDVAFATGSAELTDDARVLLNGALDRISTHTGPVCVEGYADSVGDDAANLTLSQDRAASVAAYLTDAGLGNEIEAVGFGESLATVDDTDDPALRRVDIKLAACDG